MVPLAFQGGTCLRFLFGLPRYSEDLDFTLEVDPSVYDLRGWLAAIRAHLSREGYAVAVSVRDRNPVHSAFVRFPGVLHDAGLSPRREESLAIRIEMDTRPPSGAVLETRLTRLTTRRSRVPRWRGIAILNAFAGAQSMHETADGAGNVRRQEPVMGGLTPLAAAGTVGHGSGPGPCVPARDRR